MEDIVIIGSGGFAREVAFLIEEINHVSPRWNILGYVESNRQNLGQPIGKYSVFCSDDDLLEMNISAAIAIGNPKIIRKVKDRFTSNKNVKFPNLIHPGTIYDKERVTMGSGNIVCAGNIFTTDIYIGYFNIFNLSCTYGHDIVIKDCCVFNPGVNVSGAVEIEPECLIGTGAKILQNRKLGKGVTVGAGAVVTKDIPPGTTVVGIPAKPIEK